MLHVYLAPPANQARGARTAWHTDPYAGPAFMTPIMHLAVGYMNFYETKNATTIGRFLSTNDLVNFTLRKDSKGKTPFCTVATPDGESVLSHTFSGELLHRLCLSPWVLLGFYMPKRWANFDQPHVI